MPPTRITRETLIEESVQRFIRDELITARGYPADQIDFVDAFEERRFDALRKIDKNIITTGFNFDDGGTPIEMGSDLIERTYTIEFWVIGVSYDHGQNLANAIRGAAENERGTIPLRDFRQAGAPIVDYLLVDPVRVQRQPVPDPKPWQENLWLVFVPVVDQYVAGEW